MTDTCSSNARSNSSTHACTWPRSSFARTGEGNLQVSSARRWMRGRKQLRVGHHFVQVWSQIVRKPNRRRSRRRFVEPATPGLIWPLHGTGLGDRQGAVVAEQGAKMLASWDDDEIIRLNRHLLESVRQPRSMEVVAVEVVEPSCDSGDENEGWCLVKPASDLFNRFGGIGARQRSSSDLAVGIGGRLPNRSRSSPNSLFSSSHFAKSG